MRQSKALPLAVISGLIALNVVLLVLLYRPQQDLRTVPATPGGSPPNATATATPFETEPTTPDTTASPGVESSPTPTDAATSSSSPRRGPATTSQRLLLAGSNGQLWRAEVGSCNKAGRLEASDDNGKTWSAVSSGLSPLVRLGLDAEDELFAIGGEDSCSARYVSYAQNEQDAKPNQGLDDVWYTRPKDRDVVHSPGGETSRPCQERDLLSLADLDDRRAAALCSNGHLLATWNGGQAWSSAGTLPAAVALAAGPNGYLAAGADEDCDGLLLTALRITNEELVRDGVRCVPGAEPAGRAVALTWQGDTIWLWSGDEFRTFRAGGASWR